MKKNINTASFDFQSDPRKRFLDLFSANRRSTVTNRFCYAVRHGCVTMHSIITYVVGESRRLRDDDVVRIIQHNPVPAHEFAEYIFERERLPSEIKEQIKKKRSALHREAYLKTQPPTDKQIKFLRALGYDGEVTGKWEASQLIDKLTK